MAEVDWIETDSQDNGLATATRAAESGRQHVVALVTASFDGNTDGLFRLFDGSTAILEIQVHDDFELDLGHPIALTEGNKAEATLEASGGAGTVGYIGIGGFTR